MQKFKPEKFVQTEVTFTRCLYAQLVRQKFHPPKVFGSEAVLPPSHPDHKAMDLGVKLVQNRFY
jgi:hypothetical protein